MGYGSSRANGAKSRGPVTPAGKLAALANSTKSTGPVTPEGKAIAACDALRQGILAESILLDNESAESFSEILSALHEELQPAPGIESRFVETMAIAEWCRLRLMCLEKEQLAMEIRRQRLLTEESSDLANLNATPTESGPEPTESDPLRYTTLAFRALCDNSRARNSSSAPNPAMTASTSAHCTDSARIAKPANVRKGNT